MAWKCTIERVQNGYSCTHMGIEDEDLPPYVIEEDLNDPLREHEALLRWIMQYFDFQGSKHDPERLRIVREKNNG